MRKTNNTHKTAMSRKKRNLIFAVVIAVVMAVSAIDHLLQRPPADYSNPAQHITVDFAKYHQKNFKVVKIVDGDTIDIDIPDGKYPHTRLRLLGIDTPETKKRGTPIQHFGPEASAETKRLAFGKTVMILLDTVSRTRDKYGRLLCFVQLPNGNILNERLVADGFARADLRFKHSYYKKYKKLGIKAQKKGKGLWQNISTNQTHRKR